MNKLFKIKYLNKNGSVLLLTLLILSSMLTIALGGANLIAQGINMNRIQMNSTQALFAADSGTERILFLSRKNEAFYGTNLTNCGIDPNFYLSFPAADTPVCQNNPNLATATVTLDSDGSTYKVKASSSASMYTFFTKGSYRGTNRTVEIFFK